MGNLTLWGYLREQTARVVPAPIVDLDGKTVMVIGANTGLGFEASKHFARMNPGRLILACRSKEKGKAALNALKNETGCEVAELWIIDLASFASVVEFADKFEKDGGRLDILVENAATESRKYEASGDGWESTLQVNCLSLSLLGLRLLPKMIDTGVKYETRPRFVVVTSEVHFWAKLDDVLDSSNIFETLGSEEFCTTAVMRYRYLVTKLLNVFFYHGLNARIRDSPVVVCGVNPGFCYSELRRSVTGFSAFFVRLLEKALARTTEEGGRQLIYASVDDEVSRGAYVSAMRVSEASDYALNDKGIVIQNRLWKEMMDILAKVDPRVREVENKYLAEETSG